MTLPDTGSGRLPTDRIVEVATCQTAIPENGSMANQAVCLVMTLVDSDRTALLTLMPAKARVLAREMVEKADFIESTPRGGRH